MFGAYLVAFAKNKCVIYYILKFSYISGKFVRHQKFKNVFRDARDIFMIPGVKIIHKMFYQ